MKKAGDSGDIPARTGTLDPVSEEGNDSRGRGGRELGAGAGVEATVEKGEWAMASVFDV